MDTGHAMRRDAGWARPTAAPKRQRNACGRVQAKTMGHFRGRPAGPAVRRVAEPAALEASVTNREAHNYRDVVDHCKQTHAAGYWAPCQLDPDVSVSVTRTSAGAGGTGTRTKVARAEEPERRGEGRGDAGEGYRWCRWLEIAAPKLRERSPGVCYAWRARAARNGDKKLRRHGSALFLRLCVHDISPAHPFICPVASPCPRPDRALLPRNGGVRPHCGVP